MRQTVLIIGFLCLCARAAEADQLTLKNGDRLSGTIVKADAKTLLLKTDLAGDINLQWDAVTSIVSSQTLHLALKDGQTIVGTVTTTDGKLEVATKETGPVTATGSTALADAEAEDAANADLGDAEVAAAEAAIAHVAAPAAVPEIAEVPPVPAVPPVSGVAGVPELAPGEEVPAADR